MSIQVLLYYYNIISGEKTHAQNRDVVRDKNFKAAYVSTITVNASNSLSAQAAASIQLVDLAAEVDRPDQMVSLGIAALAMYPKTG